MRTGLLLAVLALSAAAEAAGDGQELRYDFELENVRHFSIDYTISSGSGTVLSRAEPIAPPPNASHAFRFDVDPGSDRVAWSVEVVYVRTDARVLFLSEGLWHPAEDPRRTVGAQELAAIEASEFTFAVYDGLAAAVFANVPLHAPNGSLDLVVSPLWRFGDARVLVDGEPWDGGEIPPGRHVLAIQTPYGLLERGLTVGSLVAAAPETGAARFAGSALAALVVAAFAVYLARRPIAALLRRPSMRRKGAAEEVVCAVCLGAVGDQKSHVCACGFTSHASCRAHLDDCPTCGAKA